MTQDGKNAASTALALSTKRERSLCLSLSVLSSCRFQAAAFWLTVLIVKAASVLSQSKERKNEHDNDDEADQIDYRVHEKTPFLLSRFELGPKAN